LTALFYCSSFINKLENKKINNQQIQIASDTRINGLNITWIIMVFEPARGNRPDSYRSARCCRRVTQPPFIAGPLALSMSFQNIREI
jgi:hypothetical protein